MRATCHAIWPFRKHWSHGYSMWPKTDTKWNLWSPSLSSFRTRGPSPLPSMTWPPNFIFCEKSAWTNSFVMSVHTPLALCQKRFQFSYVACRVQTKWREIKCIDSCPVYTRLVHPLLVYHICILRCQRAKPIHNYFNCARKMFTP
jgi:hypothetical protein